MKKIASFYHSCILKLNLWLLFFLTTSINAQILQVNGNNIIVANNDTTPDLSDFTDFGSVPINTVKGTTFVLKK